MRLIDSNLGIMILKIIRRGYKELDLDENKVNKNESQFLANIMRDLLRYFLFIMRGIFC